MCCKNKFEKVSNSFLVAKFQEFVRESDYNKVLNAQYSAFLRVSHFHIISVNEYHGQTQNYTYKIVKMIQPQVSKQLLENTRNAQNW